VEVGFIERGCRVFDRPARVVPGAGVKGSGGRPYISMMSASETSARKVGGSSALLRMASGSRSTKPHGARRKLSNGVAATINSLAGEINADHGRDAQIGRRTVHHGGWIAALRMIRPQEVQLLAA
jgi:hypothetical protein